MNNSYLGVVVVMVATLTQSAWGFCGFYVGRADTDLFNESSKVVIARQQHKTVITMASDYHGQANEFALVVPVPMVLERGQIHVTNNAVVDHLDAYTAPRLVEYFDDDPCRKILLRSALRLEVQSAKGSNTELAKSLGITIEAKYTVGEYDILILSAGDSDGLQRWLNQSGYRVPAEADRVLDSYIKQGMKFFIARVNLEEHTKRGGGYLRPLQVAFEHDRFMLPIRLGMVNTRGSQDMFVFILTAQGRVETTNYRTVKIPSNTNIPLFVRTEFPAFYKAMFDTVVARENHQAVFMEYAWDMGWCDPCAADPMSGEELRELGVHWLPRNQTSQPLAITSPGQSGVFVTRLHVRYSREHFPEDLLFRETSDRNNFQGRYIVRHPYRGDPKACEAARPYYAGLPERFATEAEHLANLTGWDLNTIRNKMENAGQPAIPLPPPTWWEQLWEQ